VRSVAGGVASYFAMLNLRGHLAFCLDSRRFPACIRQRVDELLSPCGRKRENPRRISGDDSDVECLFFVVLSDS